MSKISRRGLRIAAAAGAGVMAVAAWTTTAHAGPVSAAAAAAKARPASTRVQLAAMPRGTVTFIRKGNGEVDLMVSALGLTPGSSHEVALVNGSGQVIATFSPLVADATGQARGEALGSRYTGPVGYLRLAVLAGNGIAPVNHPTIAWTAQYERGRRTYPLIPLETGMDGTSYGTPQGSAVIAYDRNARTISVTVNASGFTPGAHAAHIHVGSCAAQGPVRYMLMDFMANRAGQIVDQTRVVTHVAAPLPVTGWYLNLHQGNSGNILAGGRPTIYFRPLLCGDIGLKR
jgi:Cu/Zn superoxide dismutase